MRLWTAAHAPCKRCTLPPVTKTTPGSMQYCTKMNPERTVHQWEYCGQFFACQPVMWPSSVRWRACRPSKAVRWFAEAVTGWRGDSCQVRQPLPSAWFLSRASGVCCWWYPTFPTYRHVVVLMPCHRDNSPSKLSVSQCASLSTTSIHGTWRCEWAKAAGCTCSCCAYL